jgi:hypothetical protein
MQKKSQTKIPDSKFKKRLGRAGNPLPAAIAKPRFLFRRDGAHGVARPATTIPHWPHSLIGARNPNPQIP